MQRMTNDKAQSANQGSEALLKIRGVRRVMRIAQVTPFVPLTLRGRSRRRGGFDIGAFGFWNWDFNRENAGI